MTGPELRSLLAEWRISRSMFVDALALIGYRTEVEYVSRWNRVPETAIKLAEEWRAHPERRPVFVKRPAVQPMRRIVG